MKSAVLLLLVWSFMAHAQSGVQDPPIKALLASDVQQEVDDFILQQMDSSHIPGLALAVVQHDTIRYARGYGVANLELQSPVQIDSKFLIGSITKSFTAVALMMMWEEGRFSLSDPIGDYVQDIPDAWKSLSIEQLLNHTSGIPSIEDGYTPCTFNFNVDEYTRMNYLQEVMCLPLEFTPGSEWKYSSSTGYDLLGMMIEKLSGENYYAFIRKHIYEPLSMKDSYWIEYDSVIANRVDGYNYKDGAFQNSDKLDAIGEYAHGGLMSTVLDLLKFDKALLEGQLVKKETLERMLTPATLNDGTVVPYYGLGFGLTPYEGHERMGHTGAAPGFATAYSRFMLDDLSIIVFTNKDSDFGMLTFANKIARYFLD